MYIKLLKTNLNKMPHSISAESRFFLIKLVQEYKLDAIIHETVKVLSKKFGVSDHVIKTAFTVLVEEGVLNRSNRTSVKGGANRSYKYSDKFVNDLLGIPENEHEYIHLTLINNLLEPDTSTLIGGEINANGRSIGRTRSKQRHPLKISNRLLLCVLLVNSSRNGLVNNLGISEICHFTGMSKDRVNCQLNKLYKLSYLIYNVSGVTGKYLFGVAKGAYFLDLKNINYSQDRYSGSTFIYSQATIYQASRVSEVDELYSKMLRLRQQFKKNRKQSLQCNITTDLNTHEVVFDYFTDFFRDTILSGVRQYLYFKVQQYASLLLSNNWNELSDPSCIDSKELRELLSKELIPSKMKSEKKFNSTFSAFNNSKVIRCTEEQKKILIDLIFDLVVDCAMRIKVMLMVKLTLPFSKMTHEIIPLSHNSQLNNLIAIESLYKNECDKEPCVYYYVEDGDVDFNKLVTIGKDIKRIDNHQQFSDKREKITSLPHDMPYKKIPMRTI